jgi:RTX calcium-binding nonapeptide repeat (4 copies)
MLVFALGPGAGVASAGKVTVATGLPDPTGAVTWEVSFAADPGEVNAVKASYDGANITIRDDGAPISSAEGCVRASEREVACPYPKRIRSPKFALATGDRADAVAIGVALGNFIPIDVNGGTDDDTLAGSPMPDRLFGGEGDGNDVLLGFDGADDLHGGPGKDRSEGGPGDDRLFDAERSGAFAPGDLLDGGDGRDLADYGLRTRRVSVDLTRPDQAGERGERDQLRSIENVNGGEGRDRLFGTAAPNNISGHEGSDLIRGRAGNDLLAGGPGADRIEGGAGSDDLEAGEDEARRKRPDRLLCGRGRDVLTAPDRNDLVAASCEQVSLGGDQLIRAHPVRLTPRSASFRIHCPPPDDYDPFIDEPDPCPGRLTLRAGKRKLGSRRYRVRFRKSRRVAVKLRRLRTRRGRKVRLQVAVRDQEGEVWAYSIRARVR